MGIQKPTLGERLFSPYVSDVKVGKFLGIIENLVDTSRPLNRAAEPPSTQYSEIMFNDLVTLSVHERHSIQHLRRPNKKKYPHPRRVLRQPFNNQMHNACLVDRIKSFQENIAAPTRFPTTVYIFQRRFVFTVKYAKNIEVYAFTKHARRHTGVLRTLAEHVKFCHELRRGRLWIAHAVG